MKPKLLAVVFVAFLLSLAGAAPGANAEEGVEVFRSHKCTKCHSINVLGMGVVEEPEDEEEDSGFDDDWGGDEEDLEPPDLSGVANRHDAQWIAKFLQKDIASEKGNKHKERFKGSAKEQEALIAFLMTLKTDAPEED
jgi:cytochrome c2